MLNFEKYYWSLDGLYTLEVCGFLFQFGKMASQLMYRNKQFTNSYYTKFLLSTRFFKMGSAATHQPLVPNVTICLLIKFDQAFKRD